MFEALDAVLLARIQFAFTVSFHIIFPAFSIGLASYLMVLEGLWLKTENPVYLRLFKYWRKIFAVAFGMGVDRLAMLKYGAPDLRAFFDGDARWIKHYGFSPLDVPSLYGGLSR